MRKNNFMVFLTAMVLVFMGCSSQQSTPKEKLPPKCDTKEIREAAVEYILHGLCEWEGHPKEELECIKDKTKDRVLDIEWKEDLGILAGTKTRVCKDGRLAYHHISGEYKGKTYRPRVTTSYMFYYDTDGKLVVKYWEKGEEN
jgi:hypothetical protein